METTLKKISLLYSKIDLHGCGAISENEAHFLCERLISKKPKNVVEIGCATGFSTTILSKVSNLCNRWHTHSIDTLNHFYGKPSKKVGFLCDELLSKEERELLSLYHPYTAFDIPKLIPNIEFEFAFIDACHEHPWPTLDMIALLPHMTDNSQIVHHDLNLYKCKRCMADLGPKFIYDQFDLSEKDIFTGNNPNIFSINIFGDYKRYASKLIDSLNLPWSLRSRPQAKLMFQIGNYIKEYWADTDLYHWYCFSLERYY